MANILVIDDDVHITHLLKTHFTAGGHQVTVAHRGQEGMAVAEKEHPDIILLDVILPDVTGFQLCSRLRKTENTETTPILMITGVARYPNQQEFGRERGANEYILKPFDLVELGETVDRYLTMKPEDRAMPKKVVTPMPEPPKPTSHEIGKLRSFILNALHRRKMN